jgi:TusA-related sulfurtransferase
MELKLVKTGDEYELDCRDLVCPYPVLLTKLAMQRVDRLTVITNNPPSVKDIEVMAKKEGWKSEVTKDGKDWRIKLMRS